MGFIAVPARLADREFAFFDFGGRSTALEVGRSRRAFVDGWLQLPHVIGPKCQCSTPSRFMSARALQSAYGFGARHKFNVSSWAFASLFAKATLN
jgi:hypothetical protein